jgi:hypothetical protein
MRRLISTRSLILSAVAAVLLTVAVPSATLAQGRGHGKGHGNGDWSNRIDRNRSTSYWRNTSRRNRHYNKKCGKFVNCHDARDGRIDGRGPRGTRVGNDVWRNRFRNRTNTTNAWRYRDRRNLRRVYVNR